MDNSLRYLPIFGQATPEELSELAAASAEVHAEPDHALFPDYETTDSFWLLLEGRWRVTRRVAGRERVMFEADRPGSWTGGIPIVDAVAPVRAEVLSPSRFLKVPIAAMHVLVAASPGTARRLIKGLEWGAKRIGGLLDDDKPTAAGDEPGGGNHA